MYYEYLSPNVDNRLRLMYTDTDSLMVYYPGSREDFIKKNKDVLDLSLFPDLAKKLGIDPE